MPNAHTLHIWYSYVLVTDLNQSKASTTHISRRNWMYHNKMQLPRAPKTIFFVDHDYNPHFGG